MLEDLTFQLGSGRIAVLERIASANNWKILCLSADMNSSLSNGLVTPRAHAIYKVPLKSSLIRLPSPAETLRAACMQYECTRTNDETTRCKCHKPHTILG